MKKINKTIIFMLLISMLLAQAVFASTIDIDFFSLLQNDDISTIISSNKKDDLVIKTLKDTDDFYYIHIFNTTTREGLAIVKIDKANIKNVQVYSIYNTKELKNNDIYNINVDENNNIWFVAYENSNGKLCKINNEGVISCTSYNPTDTILKLCKDSIKWYDANTREIFSWDGENAVAWTVKEALSDFTENDSHIYYTNLSGNIYRIDEDSDVLILNVYEYLKLNEKTDSIDAVDLISAGGKLWLAAGLITSTEAMIINTGLVNITDNKVYNDVQIGEIIDFHENGDGSLYFQTAPYFPPVPNMQFSTVHELLIKDGKATVSTYDEYYEYIDQKYIDKSSNIFTYNTTKNTDGLAKVAPDETSVNYYFTLSNNNKTDIKVRCNDNYIGFDSNPYIKNDRTMVPIRGLMYILGGTSNWDNGTVTIEKGSTKVVLKIDNNEAYVNGNKITLDAAPEIINGRTMVPLRFILENFSVNVDWDKTNREVIINEDIKF